MRERDAIIDYIQQSSETISEKPIIDIIPIGINGTVVIQKLPFEGYFSLLQGLSQTQLLPLIREKITRPHLRIHP